MAKKSANGSGVRSTQYFVLCTRYLVAALLLFLRLLHSGDAVAAEAKPTAQIRIDPGHPWRPPFGLDRIGRPLTAVVEIAAGAQPATQYALAAYLDGKEITRSVLSPTGKPPYSCQVSFPQGPTELVLEAKSADGKVVDLARQKVDRPAFEAEAIARPERIINPVDLGAILVPSDWLLLAGGQKGKIDVAAICRTSPTRKVGQAFQPDGGKAVQPGSH